MPALIRFYDFEGPDTPPYPVGLQSNIPAVEIGTATTMFLDNGTPGVAYTVGRYLTRGGDPFERACRVPARTLPRWVSTDQGKPNLGLEIPMSSSQGIYDVTSVSFALRCQRKRLLYCSASDQHRWRIDFYY